MTVRGHNKGIRQEKYAQSALLQKVVAFMTTYSRLHRLVLQKRGYEQGLKWKGYNIYVYSCIHLANRMVCR